LFVANAVIAVGTGISAARGGDALTWCVCLLNVAAVALSVALWLVEAGGIR